MAIDYATILDAQNFCQRTDSLSLGKLNIIVPAVNAKISELTADHVVDGYLKLIACKYIDYELSNMNGVESYSAGEIFKFQSDFESKIYGLLGSYLSVDNKPKGVIIKVVS